MRVSALVRVSSVCVFALSLEIPARLQAQQKPVPESSAAQEASPTTGESKVPDPNTIRILYTGRLLGYFRVPDWQGPEVNGGGCDPVKQAGKSTAANDFDNLLVEKHARGAILVGTGDNFAPEIEARDFCSPPADQTGVPGPYRRVAKELFGWDGTAWLTNEKIQEQDLKDPNTLRYRLAHGGGTI